jgi:hypothetical protein
VEVEVGGDGGN